MSPSIHFTVRYRDQAIVIHRSLEIVNDLYLACNLNVDLNVFDDISVNESFLTPDRLTNIKNIILDNPQLDKEREDLLDTIDLHSNMATPPNEGKASDEEHLDKESKAITEFLDGLLTASAILRNSELVDEAKLKQDAYRQLMHYWGKVMLKELEVISIAIENNKNSSEDPLSGEEASRMIYTMNLLVPNILFTIVQESLGTSKLQLVIKEHIESCDETVMRPLSTILYSDLSLPKHLDYIEKLFIDKKKHRYLVELLYVKLLNVYMANNSSESTKKQVRNLLGALYVILNDRGNKRVNDAVKNDFLLSLDKKSKQVKK